MNFYANADGRSSPPCALTDIENAMIAALKATNAFKTVESYAGEFDSEDLKTLVARFPAIWVAFAGEYQTPEKCPDGYDEYPEFSVVIAARNLRGERHARQGIKFERTPAGLALGGAGAIYSEAGAYELLGIVKDTLSRQCLDLMIDSLEPQQAEPLFIGQAQKLNMAVYGIGFRTHLFRKIPTQSDEFETAQVNWSDGVRQNINPA